MRCAPAKTNGRLHRTVGVDMQVNYFALNGACMEDSMVLETLPAGLDGQRFYRRMFREIGPNAFWWSGR